MPDSWDFSANQRTEQPYPLITYGLCALCVLFTIVFLMPNLSPGFGRVAAIVAPTGDQIWDGAYFGLLTTFFPHVNIMHILFNMMWLIQLGRAMETELPPLGYFAFLVSAAAVSQGCELAVMGHPGVGASGVVYAMFGLMWVGRARYRSWAELATRQNLIVFIVWGVFCIFGTVAGFMPVANVAHFSGLLFGIAVGWLCLAPRRRPIWAAPLIALVALTALSLFWLPWSAAWNYHRGDKAFDAGNYRAAITWYHRSLRLGGVRYYAWENIKRAWQHIEYAALLHGDAALQAEAEHQAESAARLEGPDPDLQPRQPASFGIHEAGRSQ
jgi:GlpG protein